MHDSLLADMGKAVIGAAILGLPAFFLRIPLLLAYLVAGVILGPHLGFGLIKNAESISTLSEVGLVLLMFILGLEIDLRKLMQAGKAVLINGVTQIVGCSLLAVAYFSVFGYAKNSYELTYLAVACSLSSTLIVVKILSDQMDLDSLPSRITLGTLVLQDLWAIGFLALQPNLSNLNALALIKSLLKVTLLVLTGWGIARFILPNIFKKAGKQPELMLILAIAWCFAMCSLAGFLTLSLEMGALVAGISIATFPYQLDVAAKISSLRDFFITLFFVGLGLQIPKPSYEVLTLAGLVTLFVLLSRAIIVFPVLHKMSYGNRASLFPALNLSQLSEFSVVLASLGMSYNHVTADLLSAFIIALVLSALISSFLIPSAHSIYKFLNPLLERIGFNDHVSDSQIIEDQEKKYPSVLLLGFYREASSLFYEMQRRYSKEALKDLLVVDFNPEAHTKLKELGIDCQYGDISNIDTLRHLHLSQAKLIICTIPDQVLKGTTNQKLLMTLNQLAPEAKKIVTAEKIELAKKMYLEGADYVFIPRLISAYYLADVLEKMQTDGTSSLKKSAMEFLKGRSEVIS